MFLEFETTRCPFALSEVISSWNEWREALTAVEWWGLEQELDNRRGNSSVFNVRRATGQQGRTISNYPVVILCSQLATGATWAYLAAAAGQSHVRAYDLNVSENPRDAKEQRFRLDSDVQKRRKSLSRVRTRTAGSQSAINQ